MDGRERFGDDRRRGKMNINYRICVEIGIKIEKKLCLKINIVGDWHYNVIQVRFFGFSRYIRVAYPIVVIPYLYIRD